MMKNMKLSIMTLLLTISSVLAGCSSSRPDPVDLDQVLDITATTMERMGEGSDPESAMSEFVVALQEDLNGANPKLHSQPLGVDLHDDGSIRGYNDEDSSGNKNGSEVELFKIEIDGEKNRLIASSEGYTRDHSFSGTSLIAGMLIGSMLSRQRGAGIRPSSLSSKTTSTYQSARSRSGSGSHSKGK